MTDPEINILASVNGYDWSNVEPSIFGTLFERHFDPEQGIADRRPLHQPRRYRHAGRAGGDGAAAAGVGRGPPALRRGALAESARAARTVASRHSRSGKILAQAARRSTGPCRTSPSGCTTSPCSIRPAARATSSTWRSTCCWTWKRRSSPTRPATGWRSLPHVRPTQLSGLEINPFAQQLAQVVIWIGYLQWMHHNGFKHAQRSGPRADREHPLQGRDPRPLRPRTPQRAASGPRRSSSWEIRRFWAIRRCAADLGDEYVESPCEHSTKIGCRANPIFAVTGLKRRASKSRPKKCKRAGLLATQGIRGGANRKVLERIKESGDIFLAESDRDWILEGATVHVSMVGFDDGVENGEKYLNDQTVSRINSNLSTGSETTSRDYFTCQRRNFFLRKLQGRSFRYNRMRSIGIVEKRGNPTGLANSDVLRPVVNSKDILQSRDYRWIIDNADLALKDACLYESPHEIVHKRVKPVRDVNRNKWLKDNWWRPQRMRPQMREAIRPLKRFFVTTTTSKHRIFIWLQSPILPDHQLIVFAREDDLFFGILHSRIHEIWSRAVGTQLREVESGFRYTPTTCFETFPLPHPTKKQEKAIAAAAKELDALRNRWLNPPEWTRTEVLEFPGSLSGPWARYVVEPDARGIGTVRWPRLVPKEPDCAGRTQKTHAHKPLQPASPVAPKRPRPPRRRRLRRLRLGSELERRRDFGAPVEVEFGEVRVRQSSREPRIAQIGANNKKGFVFQGRSRPLSAER